MKIDFTIFVALLSLAKFALALPPVTSTLNSWAPVSAEEDMLLNSMLDVIEHNTNIQPRQNQPAQPDNSIATGVTMLQKLIAAEYKDDKPECVSAKRLKAHAFLKKAANDIFGKEAPADENACLTQAQLEDFVKKLRVMAGTHKPAQATPGQ